MRFFWPALALLYSGCLQQLDRCTVASAGETLSCPMPGWVDRSFELVVPESYDGTPRPLVIVFHGGGGNRREARRITCPGGRESEPACLPAQAARARYLVVMPNGTGTRLLPKVRTWNGGGGKNGHTCTSGAACNARIDDMAFVDDLLTEVGRIAAVDTGRVFATGISNGGTITHRLACERSSLVRAVAAVAAGNQFAAVEPCNAQMSVLHIHGTADTCWQYLQGKSSCAGLEFQEGIKVGVAESMEGWRQRNGCTETTSETPLPDTDPTDGTTSVRVVWSGCARATELVRIEGGGHTWPRGMQYLSVDWVGRVAQDFDANQMILDFFGAQ